MKRPIGFAILAALAATLASIVVYSALRRREAELRKAVANTVEIAIAARDLPLGTRIEPGTVRLTGWSRDSLPLGAVTDPQTVMNSIVKQGFVENEPIVTTKLFSGQKGGGVLPLLIPVGMRAMSVAVDEISDVAGFILPRARVDVLISLSQSGPRFCSKVVLQNVEVLAVAQEIEGRREEPQVVRVVTLLVTLEEAERLALASNQGVLRLALRNYADDKVVLTSGSDTDSMLRAYSIPALPVGAAQASMARAHGSPFGQADIEIMRDGVRREIVSFLRGSRLPSLSQDGRETATLLPPPSAEKASLSDDNPFARPDAASGDAKNPVSPAASAAANPKTLDVP